MLQRLKSKLFPKGIKRSSLSYKNRLIRRVSPKMLLRDFKALGLGYGDFVCVHSSLSGIGHITGGSESIITALKNIIGHKGTLMMPTFTGGGSTYKYATSNPPCFDPEKTPATTGYLCEKFRCQPGVRRSLHPTHSVAVLGPHSEEMIKGHENSLTPFGEGTPYDYLIRKEGKVLLLNTNANSILHRIQELCDWPNHYLDETYTLDILDGREVRTVTTTVHSPGPYSHMVFPGKADNEVCFIHLPSYGLQFLPGENEVETFQHLDPAVAGFLQDRYQWFLDQNVVRRGKIGFGQAILFDAVLFTARIQEDINNHLSCNPDLYDRDRLKRMRRLDAASGPLPVL